MVCRPLPADMLLQARSASRFLLPLTALLLHFLSPLSPPSCPYLTHSTATATTTIPVDDTGKEVVYDNNSDDSDSDDDDDDGTTPFSLWTDVMSPLPPTRLNQNQKEEEEERDNEGDYDALEELQLPPPTPSTTTTATATATDTTVTNDDVIATATATATPLPVAVLRVLESSARLCCQLWSPPPPPPPLCSLFGSNGHNIPSDGHTDSKSLIGSNGHSTYFNGHGDGKGECKDWTGGQRHVMTR
jgi:hypothetical protein